MGKSLFYYLCEISALISVSCISCITLFQLPVGEGCNTTAAFKRYHLFVGM